MSDQHNPSLNYPGLAAANAGLALLEVLIAIVLLTASLLGAMAALTNAHHNATGNLHEARALGLAADLAAQLRADPANSAVLVEEWVQRAPPLQATAHILGAAAFSPSRVQVSLRWHALREPGRHLQFAVSLPDPRVSW
jgi:Tfp pilus assembly protein PilV